MTKKPKLHLKYLVLKLEDQIDLQRLNRYINELIINDKLAITIREFADNILNCVYSSKEQQ